MKHYGILLFLLFAPAFAELEFNRDIRPILFDNCVACHGPDPEERKAGLRLDTREGALALLESGSHGIVPNNAAESEVMIRIDSDDPDERMPPAKHAKQLEPSEIATLRQWITEGAPYAVHWSYQKPTRPALPAIKNKTWPKNPIDHFILAKLESKGLTPSPEAAPHELARRTSLDINGLPPEPGDALDHEALVDKLLADPAYGERWAALWLDLARYADSAGYADDPPRTIWGYRDWVIRAFNRNQPFDQFTIDQIAGDLLPDAKTEQLIATAFHRNTLTNNEGGTNDEEFRNAAVVDRVNTTMEVWMGTTMACVQCHTHKYDPITNEEYFQFFAFFNNTEDADRRNEAPTIPVFSEAQQTQRSKLSGELDALKALPPPSPAEVATARAKVEAPFKKPISWQAAKLDQNVLTPAQPITAIRVPVSAKVSGLQTVAEGVRPQARYVRVDLPEQKQFLHLAEVEVFSAGKNIAPKGKATQSSTGFGGPAKYANDGNTDGRFEKKSVSHTLDDKGAWWEVDLRKPQAIDKVVVWNRTDGTVGNRTRNYRVQLFDKDRKPIWEDKSVEEPKPSREHVADGPTTIPHLLATVGEQQWLLLKEPLKEPAKLITAGAATAEVSSTPEAAHGKALPLPVLQAFRHPAPGPAQAKILDAHFAKHNPIVLEREKQTAALQKQIDAIKAETTVPIFRERVSNRRTTQLQVRGNWQAKAQELSEATPAVFHPLPKGAKRDRLTLAKWLVSRDNPLTARVTVNRFWQSYFGVGLVATAEEFGSQGELPTHPELLDWLAIEFMESGWDLKALHRLITTSATYRQSARETAAHRRDDPFNKLYTRGPRVRLSAEMIRDQALAVSGLLSRKMYGKPARPPRPKLGLRAAFGGSTDWTDSTGEDRYRRGIYTEWRRSMPYPSMATFDAPNREVCTTRRGRTNTPLQALVTMNDPVYVEASQALGRRLARHDGKLEEQLAQGILLCLNRNPRDGEVAALKQLYEESLTEFKATPADAKALATEPIGALPDGFDAVTLAAWTMVGNVLLNLDEMLQKP